MVNNEEIKKEYNDLNCTKSLLNNELKNLVLNKMEIKKSIDTLKDKLNPLESEFRFMTTKIEMYNNKIDEITSELENKQKELT